MSLCGVVSVRPSLRGMSKWRKKPHHIFSISYVTAIVRREPPNESVACTWGRKKSRFRASLHRVLSTLRPARCYQQVTPDRGKLWHLSLVESGGVCWWQETTTKCLWQEVSTSRQRQLNVHLIARSDSILIYTYIAYVSNNKRLIDVCSLLLKLTTERYEASRGLLATAELLVNKCIGDDTKADARQRIQKVWRKRFSIRRMELLHPAMWHVALKSWQ